MTSSKLSIQDTLPLTNCTHKIPRLGFGLYLSPPTVSKESCLSALRSGYRHIDSAQYYQNEAEMGAAVRASGIPRSEVFLCTKVLSPGGCPEKTYQKLLDSVKRIGGEAEGAQGGDMAYVDLFLIHSPHAGAKARKEMWQGLERLYEEGRAKAIGVSNFGVGTIEEMREWAKVFPPMVNQIEVCKSFSFRFSCFFPSVLGLAFSRYYRGEMKLKSTGHGPSESRNDMFDFVGPPIILTISSPSAPPLVPTTHHRRLLQKERHSHRSLRAHRQESESA